MNSSYKQEKQRFRQTDTGENLKKGLEIVKKRFGVDFDLESLKYDILLFQGGLGYLEKTAISFNVSTFNLKLFTESNSYVSLLNLDLDHEEILFLIGFDESENDLSIIESAFDFINENKSNFQSKCNKSQTYFNQDSGVNDWELFWYDNHTLNYLSYSQQ